jgi:serine/threonine protein kinase
MSTQHNQARAIFLEAIEQYAPEDRDDFLDQACAGNPQLRARVESLLHSHQLLGTFHDQASPTTLTIDQPPVEQPGRVIGPYKLLDQIGEGGMGVVFMAEQTAPVRRKVALKIIKPGMDTRQVIARFEAERQALAMMDHPNIAKVLDAGTTDDRSKLEAQARGGDGETGGGGEPDLPVPLRISPSPPLPFSPSHSVGRPYFVMELVQGVSVTEYCDQCHLTTRERLELFITVCRAVQHAHQKGVIHRDIKPTNVLVAMQDGRPAPKIIDFGVAKAIGQRLTEHTLTTAFAQMVGSPLYMSPEQAELSPLGVDTRSDIYSLGVLLYELLAGTTPFDKDRLHAASYDEMRRIIREEEPPRPSARISTLAADLATTVAERRHTDTRRLSQQVRGELDWIVMKCLEKDRNRRYETAGGLARDIERYLHDEPVQACPPSASYRFRKFARRNKTLLAAGAAVAAALVVGLGLSTWMYIRAAAESARAKSVSGLLQEMLGSANPAGEGDTDYTVRQLMIYDDIRIAYFLAATHKEEEAAEFVRKAALKAKRLEDPGGLANSLYYVALMQLRLGDEAGYRANCKALFEVPVGDLADLGKSRPIWTPCLAANALEDLNLLVRRAEAYVANAAPDHRHFVLSVLGAALYRAGRYREAAERLEECGAAYPNDLPPPFSDVINYQRLFLAMTKWQLGERDTARRLLAVIQPDIDKELQSESIVWNRRATLEVLRREAENLIEPTEADEAVENNEKSSSGVEE